MSIDALSTHPLTDWQDIAATELAVAETRLFIDGEFRDGVSGGRFESANPVNREVNAATAASTSARKAFQNGSWSGMSPLERMLVFDGYATQVRVFALA